MKNRKLLSLIAMMLVSPLHASDKEKDSMEECKKDYDSALAVMQQRQKGDLLINGTGKYHDYNFYRVAGKTIKGKDKGEALNEAEPVNVRSLLP